MASSYTISLRAELQGTGENSGTWGLLNNSNYQNVFEAAIAGVANIAMPNSDYTLTTANNAADQARAAVLNLSGTLTATRNVICPAVTKTYLVRNGTTQSIVIKTASGTGVTIPSGGTTPVWCNGTNVLASTTYLPSLTVPSWSVDATFFSALSTGNPRTTVDTNDYYDYSRSLDRYRWWINGVEAMRLDATTLQVNGREISAMVGEIKLWPGTALPTGFQWCSGAAISRTTFADLFAVIGTTYGVGDGTTTFNLPDLRGRVPIGRDNMNASPAGRLANSFGSSNAATVGFAGGDDRLHGHTHTVTDPGHSHVINDPGHVHTAVVTDPGHQHTLNGGVVIGGGSGLGPGGAAGTAFGFTTVSNAGISVAIQPKVTGISLVSANTGITAAATGGGTGQNIPPAVIMNYIIRA